MNQVDGQECVSEKNADAAKFSAIDLLLSFAHAIIFREKNADAAKKSRRIG